MDVLIITVIHHPLDARIHRQVGALLESGHHVRVAAPWKAHDATPPAGVDAIDLPRAEGRQRLAAVHRTREFLEEHARSAAVVLVHAPELLPAAMRTCPERTVWDVRHDSIEAIVDKPWVPRMARPAARLGVNRLERAAERRVKLILADYTQAARFTRPHPVIPDLTWAPQKPVPPDERRLVHLGRHSRQSGVTTLLGLAAALVDDVELETIGPADAEAAPLLQAAVDDGLLTWTPFLSYDAAVKRIDGASAGLSLLADTPETRTWPPQKIREYMARGVPTVATATPAASDLLHDTGAGLVVPHDDLGATLRAIEWLLANDDERRQLGETAHAAALASHDWAPHAERFVELLEDIPRGATRWPS